MPEGIISFEKKVLSIEDFVFNQEKLNGVVDEDSSAVNLAFWNSRETPLCRFEVKSSGGIEDSGGEYLQVDFANKMLGGGTLGRGAVQEEICFMTSPELIVGMLICPRMGDMESIQIVGAECFSSHTGYASSFVFNGDYKDTTPRDSLKRRKKTIVAIDALRLPGNRQYETQLLLRELNKSYCGFRLATSQDGETVSRDLGEEILKNGHEKIFYRGVSTGNWGCGAFKGDLEIKSMIQWMAATQALHSEVHYYTFGDPKARRLFQVVQHLEDKLYTIGRLWTELEQYRKFRAKFWSQTQLGFFDWLLQPGKRVLKDPKRRDKKVIPKPLDERDKDENMFPRLFTEVEIITHPNTTSYPNMTKLSEYD